MPEEVRIVFMTLGVVTLVGLGLVVGKLLWELASAAKRFSAFCDQAESLLPEIEDALSRVGGAASEVQAVGREARSEIEDLKSGGRKVAAIVSGARAGWDALQRD